MDCSLQWPRKPLSSRQLTVIPLSGEATTSRLLRYQRLYVFHLGVALAGEF